MLVPGLRVQWGTEAQKDTPATKGQARTSSSSAGAARSTLLSTMRSASASCFCASGRRRMKASAEEAGRRWRMICFASTWLG